VKNGLILARDEKAPKGATLVDCGGKCLAPGIVDWGVKIGEPGERHRESFGSAGQAAAAGGVTTIIARPDTNPAIDTPEVLEFVTRRAAEASPVRIRHMAALTKGREGREMTEIGFLRDAGAIAFTDVFRVSTEAKALTRAMTYAQPGRAGRGPPAGPRPVLGGCGHLGKFASLRGIPGGLAHGRTHGAGARPGAGRDDRACATTPTRSPRPPALPALARAKAAGLDVTAGTSIHHLTLNEFDVGDYRTFFKFTPPLRSEDDRLAMVAAVADGTIDVISSLHTPADEESKRLPFEEAAAGRRRAGNLPAGGDAALPCRAPDLPALFRAMALNPANRLGLPQGRLALGAPADLVLFDPDAPFLMDRFKLRSKSKNTPFDGARMEGKVLATWVGGTTGLCGGRVSHA
jgi:dihydroorotase